MTTTTFSDDEIGDLAIASTSAAAANDALAADLAAQAQTQARLQDLAISSGRKEIVFIEDDVPDIGTLVQGIGAGKQVVILDAKEDGLQQIAAALQGQTGIDALHIVSHGAAGAVGLGTLLLDANDLGSESAALQAIGRSMAAGGDILLYGCDVGAGSSGQAFVDRLAIATGADVAASSNPTGSAALGGDWNLEISSGAIETRSAVDASLAALYQHTLAIATADVNFDTFANVTDPGGKYGPGYDVAYQVNGQSGYVLKIDGATQNVATYGAGYLVSDSGYGVGETLLTFSFVGGQVFSPTSIDVSNYQLGNTTQALVFKGYDAAGNLVGTRTGTTTAGVADYTTVSLAGLTNIATLKLTGDPASNGGKVVYLTFDNFELTDIHPGVPAVTSVSATDANGAYKAGAIIHVTVAFDQAVDVDTTGGTPTLQLETGSTDEQAVYTGGSGTTTLTFAYTVQAGDTSADLDYLNTAALALNGATIKLSGDTTDAALTLPAPGAAGSLGASQAIVIDTTAPTLAITSDRSTLGAGQTATVTFTFSEDPGSTFSAGDIAVSGGTLGALSGSGLTRSAVFTPTAGTDNGTASITVAAGSYTDAAGNAGGAGTTPSIGFDTQAPAAPAAPHLAASSDSGASSSDNVTSVVTPTFTGAAGSAEAGATLRLYDSDGTTVLGSTTVNGDGSWEVTSSALGQGAHTITAKAVDAAGNAGAASSALTVTIDTSAPAAPTSPDLAAASDSGTSSSDNVTGVVTPTFSGTSEAGATVTLYDTDGATVLGTTVANGSGQWSVASSALAEGAHTITARATDSAGNTSAASGGLNVTIDVSAPAAPAAPDLAAGSDSGSSSTDDITAVATPTFAGAAGSVEAGVTVKLYDTGGAEIASTVALGDGSWSVATSVLAEGAHTITAKAIDTAGNVSAASSGLALTLDLSAPTTQVTLVAFSNDTGSSSSDLVTASAAQTIAGTLDAALAAGEHVEVSLDNGSTWTTASAAGSAWSLDVTLAGSNTLQVRVVDAAGNAGVASAHAYVLDTTVPAAPSAPDLDDASDTGASNSDDITADTTPTFSGTAESGATVTLYDGSTAIGSGVAVDGTWHITSDVALGQGAHDISAKATDVAGNQGAASAVLTVQVLTDGPGTGVSSVAFSSDSGASATDFITVVPVQTISGTLSAVLAGGEQVEVSIDGGASWVAATATTGEDGWSLTTALADGTHDLEVRVTDAVGNSGPVLVQPYTLDTVAPSLAISSSAAQLKAGETATITFTFSEDPGSTFTWDGSAGDVVVSGGTLSALSGTGLVRTAIFTPSAGTNAGSASITVAAGAYADLAGNSGAAGSLPALAFDTLAPDAPTVPVLAAASDTGTVGDGITTSTSQVVQGSGAANAAVTLYDGASVVGSATADADGNWSITAHLGTGSHTLTATQADAAGNVSAHSAAFALTVNAAQTTPTPPATTLIDGVAVQIQAVTLPGGVAGTAISVPIVTTSRSETSGTAGVADIPLASAGSGAHVLLAQLPPGYGLSASGANVDVASGLELLIASIKAATPTHAADDQSHLTGNGETFLAALAASDALLVETVKPVSATAPDGALVLSGADAGAGQDVALVIDGSGLAAGSTIALQSVDFAAVIGAVDVSADAARTLLSGDAAGQHFTVTAGTSSAVFAGGGADVMTFAQAQAQTAAQQAATGLQARALAAAASDVTTLHGGTGSDTAAFAGASADYDVEYHNGYVLVGSKAAPGDVALVVNAEQLQFGDTSIAIADSAALDTVAGMYQTVLGRQADLYGFEFWADAHDAGASWGAIALGMIGSSERLAGQEDFNGNAAHDVTLLYEALFERAPDAAGLAFWQNTMSQGATLEQVATGMVESVEMVGHQRVATDWDFLV